MPEILRTREELPKLDSLALVPTMGALHQGHLSLTKLAHQYAKKVMVSIFVNPLQFAQGEDFDKYPRCLEDDAKSLEGLADYIWAPSYQDIFPSEPPIIKANPELTNKLCGLSRPGHFEGVCTVVHELFQATQPQFAVFGEKDFQQLIIIEDMVKRLSLAIEIIRAPISREASGLAMSSRNQYLLEHERELASNIYKNLQAISRKELTIESAIERLGKNGINTEYLEPHWARLFFAGQIGNTRLIDNIGLDFE